VVALRLVAEDFNSFDVVHSEIQASLGAVLSKFAEVDLILDCRVCTASNHPQLSSEIVEFGTKFSAVYNMRKFIVTGSSIPPSIADLVETNSDVIIQRYELAILRLVKASLSAKINFFIADYGTISPYYSDVEMPPEVLQSIMTPKIAYSFKDEIWITRGGAMKTHPQGYSQYNYMAHVLVNKSFFRGAGHSFGDNYFVEKSQHQGNNATPSTIVKPTLNAHITYMMEDYI